MKKEAIIIYNIIKKNHDVPTFKKIYNFNNNTRQRLEWPSMTPEQLLLVWYESIKYKIETPTGKIKPNIQNIIETYVKDLINYWKKLLEQKETYTLINNET